MCVCIIQMLQVYERAYLLCVVTQAYKICQMLQSWDKLLSTSTSTKLHRDCGILLYDQEESDFVHYVKQKSGPLPPGSAVNLNKLNVELFIKMLYGVWCSLQPDHETRGGGVLPYITYTGMCLPTGSWFWSSWFRTGYPVQRRFLERGNWLLFDV